MCLKLLFLIGLKEDPINNVALGYEWLRRSHVAIAWLRSNAPFIANKYYDGIVSRKVEINVPHILKMES